MTWRGLPQDGGVPHRRVGKVLGEGMQRATSEDVVVSRQRGNRGRVPLEPHAWKTIQYFSRSKPRHPGHN